MVEIKFCGMTRAEDADCAATLGARYVGLIFAGGPRCLTADAARLVVRGLPQRVARVGVFGAQSADEIASCAKAMALHVVQLHDDPDAHAVAEVRRRWSGQVWAVQRLAGTELPATIEELFDVADAVLIDSRVHGMAGGTGVALPWHALRDALAPLRSRRARLVLAGGLRPENVADAIAAIEPDVVDVSSGVEASPGIKDHNRMRAFRDAVEKHGGRRR